VGCLRCHDRDRPRSAAVTSAGDSLRRPDLLDVDVDDQRASRIRPRIRIFRKLSISTWSRPLFSTPGSEAR
jgi:hypothetical protein